MKTRLLLATLTLLVAGCAGPLGSLGRAFPDGSTFTIEEVNMQASMTGSGSIVLKGVKCVGTNGFQISGDSTNATLKAKALK